MPFGYSHLAIVAVSSWFLFLALAFCKIAGKHSYLATTNTLEADLWPHESFVCKSSVFINRTQHRQKIFKSVKQRLQIYSKW